MLLEVRDITKQYGETLALNKLSFTAKSGEILGVAGPNGAGKSTMIRILAHEETADSGEILLDGVAWSSLKEKAKVAVVHQESQLYPNLTVAENLLIGREEKRFWRPTILERESEMLMKLGIGNFTNQELGTCPLLVRQLCEISRALVVDATVFLFDEPNSALTEQESGQLFEQMHFLKEAGYIVIFVTHRLRDLVAHADKVVIIRDGIRASVIEYNDLTEERLAENFVVGEKRNARCSEVIESLNPESLDSLQPLLDVSCFTHANRAFNNVNLQIMPCEVLAIMGVEGSGAREILRAICGLEPATAAIQVNGEIRRRTDFRNIAYLPASRQLSLFRNLSISENIVSRLGVPDIATRGYWLRLKYMILLAAEYVTKFNIRIAFLNQEIGSLSGGNQQKVAVAACIAKKPLIVALEEPTRGVDIQSKAEIYSFIRKFVAQGNGGLVFCTEVSEVLELADRVSVASGGKLSRSLDARSFSSAEELAASITRLELDVLEESAHQVVSH